MSEEKNPHAKALSKMGASKGGRARADKLSSAQRREIAQAGAEARWGRALPTAIYPGEIQLGELSFPCAVLSDETRVLTESDFMKGLGMYRSGALSTRRQRDEAGARAPLYLAFKNIKPFVDKHLGDVHEQQLRYRTMGGSVAHGIRAEMIPKICRMWQDARLAGVLGPRQLRIAEKADIILGGLGHIGIIGLVDEATGYQDIRARDALAKILESFVAKEIQKWVKTFPTDFYKEMFRLWRWDFSVDGAKPSAVGKLTNDLIYKRLAPGVLDELRRTTPRDEKGRLKVHYHRKLTRDVGHPALRERLAAVVALMKAFDDKDQFMDRMDRIFPKWGANLKLPGVGEYRG